MDILIYSKIFVTIIIILYTTYLSYTTIVASITELLVNKNKWLFVLVWIAIISIGISINGLIIYLLWY